MECCRKFKFANEKTEMTISKIAARNASWTDLFCCRCDSLSVVLEEGSDEPCLLFLSTWAVSGGVGSPNKTEGSG
jgi:hypothetical protein